MGVLKRRAVAGTSRKRRGPGVGPSLLSLVPVDPGLKSGRQIAETSRAAVENFLRTLPTNGKVFRAEWLAGEYRKYARAWNSDSRRSGEPKDLVGESPPTFYRWLKRLIVEQAPWLTFQNDGRRVWVGRQ